ncbi:MAG: hypothetical protein WEE66_13640 [Actinomycetota bacterium]
MARTKATADEDLRGALVALERSFLPMARRLDAAGAIGMEDRITARVSALEGAVEVEVASWRLGAALRLVGEPTRFAGHIEGAAQSYVVEPGGGYRPA